MPDTILEGDHPRIIPAKFGWDWLNSFRGEDFFQISSPLFSIFSLAAILVRSRDHRTQFWKGAIQGSFHQSFVAIGSVVSEEKIFMWISHRVLYQAKFGCGGPSWSKGRIARHIFGREPSNDYFIKILLLLSKWFQTRRFLWEFPIGSYVKLTLAVVAILVGVLKY
jgi:hypothetical protein